jgi:hypothetical protein
MVFSQGIDPFSSKREILELPATTCNFDKVVIQGKGFVSTEALTRLAESNINVIMIEEIRIMKMMCIELRDFCVGKFSVYSDQT